MSDKIIQPPELFEKPEAFAGTPDDLANRINQVAAEEAPADQPDAERTLADIKDPVELLTLTYYEVLTPQLKAILSAGIPIRAVLTQEKDGTLKLDVHPAKVVSNIDEEAQRVFLAQGKDGQPIDPDQPIIEPVGQPSQECNESETCECDAGCERQ